MTEVQRKAGFVALLGAPNTGKSTLINRLVGTKISIVTPKVQTTRSRLRGIRMVGATQLVLVDTPGIFTPKRRLERSMVHAAWRGADEADARVLLIDATRGLDADTQMIIDALIRAERRVVVALNKIDAVPRAKLLPLADAIDRSGVASAMFMISALDGDGVGDLLADLVARMPEGPWLYPADQLTDSSERLLAAEVTREQLFLQLQQELPYSLTVETEKWQASEGEVRINQIVYVTRDNHKAMVLGKGGQRIKEVGTRARAELTRMLGKRVHLFLFVKVRKNWLDDPDRYRDIGLEFDV